MFASCHGSPGADRFGRDPVSPEASPQAITDRRLLKTVPKFDGIKLEHTPGRN